MDRLTVGGVLGTGASLYARHLARFLLLTVLCYAPLVIWVALTLSDARAEDAVAVEQAEAVQQWARILALLLDVPLGAMLIFAVVRDLRGEPTTLYECAVTGLRRTLPALMIMVLVLLVVFAITVVLLMPMANAGPAAAMVMVPALLFVLLILYARWFVAIPACVVERPGILGAFARSSALTRDRRATIAIVIAFTYVIEIAVLGACWRLILPHATEASPTALAATRQAMPTFVVAYLVVSVLVASLRAVLAATAYVQLRQDKEGTSPDQLADVFA